jgi:hypothetical protein
LPREIAARGGSVETAAYARDADQSCPDQNKRRGAEASSANGEGASDEGRDDRVEDFSSAADQTFYQEAREECGNGVRGSSDRRLSGESLVFI